MTVRNLIAIAIVAGAASPAFAASQTDAPRRQAYFGELHLHTAMSFDAFVFGARITPDQAYKFGRGETVIVPAEQMLKQQGVSPAKDVPARRAWPLDFMAVTDHAEFMGALTQLEDPNSAFSKSDTGKKIVSSGRAAFFMFNKAMKAHSEDIVNAAAASNAWAVQLKAANDNNEPGKFTTLIGYEWTSTPNGRHFHRNVIFEGDTAPSPFTAADSEKAEDLWTYLEKVRARGIDVIAIPHSADLSGGMQYDWNNGDGHPIDEAYAQRRALNEPLTEIVQTKGQSDTTPDLSPNDEFANFEIFDRIFPGDTAPRHHGSFVREAYGHGLMLKQKLGVNPFKFGVVGGSDLHNGLSTSDENAFAGDASGIDPATMLPQGKRAVHALNLDNSSVAVSSRPGENNPLTFGSSGITGVWAEENTRPAIFAALKRKETFATSGTRIRVRAFGGWNFDPKMMSSGDWAAKGYAQGVPMGSDLPSRGAKGAPHLALWAMKDPDGANLDRIQVIKLWLEGGTYKEKIFDAALSDNRKVDPVAGKAPPVGNTVDPKTGAYTNSIGAAELETVWVDPEFDPKTPAVYYTRTLEIPTPRWSTLLAVKNNLPIPQGVPATIQERAWTSPIWYTPTKS